MDRDEIFKFRYEDRELMEKAFTVRERVFIKEQGVPEKDEKDKHDQDALHFLLLRMGNPLATARYRQTEKGYKLERFAVLKQLRGTGLGGKILNYILDDLRDTDQMIYLNAQEQVVAFYEKYGFRKQGSAFLEAGIRHYQIILKE